jgi:diacylglycerol kinase (ATP)
LRHSPAAQTLVIVNPRAGGAPEPSSLAVALEPLGPVRLVETTRAGHAALLAREADSNGVERIVVVGGDGTLHEVVNGLEPPSRCVLGLIPAGTGNDLARSLGIPLDHAGAIDVIRAGRASPVDVVRVAVEGVEEIAINAACGGFGGEVNARITQDLKDRWGPLAYVKASMDTLRELPVYRVRLRFDRRDVAELSVHSLVVANGAFAAHGICVAPGARTDDGVLAVHAVLPRPLKDLLAVAPTVLSGKVPDAEHYRVWRCLAVSVTSEQPIEFSVDGELRRGRSYRYQIRPRAVRIMRRHPGGGA